MLPCINISYFVFQRGATRDRRKHTDPANTQKWTPRSLARIHTRIQYLCENTRARPLGSPKTRSLKKVVGGVAPFGVFNKNPFRQA